MLTVDELKTFISADTASTKKKNAKVGQRYYDADHDIRQYRMFFVDAEGNVKEEKTKSNIKICHPFFTELVDQEVQYMLSGEDGYVRSDQPELQQYLDEYFNENEDFTAELYECLTGCVVKGFEFMYAYKNAEDKTAFQCADSLGVVEVEARYASDKKDHVIFWYIDRIDKDNNKVKRIQDWDDQQTYYYTQVGDGKIKLDEEQEINPRPHTIYTKDKDDSTYYEGFGFIPFFRLDNCKKQFSGLHPIKELIDDYDLMACGLSNNIQDTNEALYVVSGFQGDNLDELMMNIKTKKHIGVDEDGGVDIKTIDIPYAARQTKLEIDKEAIYHFGMGVNTAGLKDTSATVSIQVKSMYSLLDMKCNKLVIRLKQFMRKLVKVVLDEINAMNGTDYKQSDVYFCFDRETPTNAQENAQIALTEAQEQQTRIGTMLNIASYLDNETLMQNICDILDIDYEDIKDKLPTEEDEAYTAQEALDAVVPEEPEAGDVVA